MAEDYSQNFGKAISYQGQPTMAIQIAREREARAAAQAERQRARDAANAQDRNKAAKKAFDVSLNEISIKDPSKFHRLYLPEQMEDKRQLLNEAAQAYATNSSLASNMMRDKIGAYEQRKAIRMDESKRRFAEESLDENKYAIDPQWKQILRTGTIDDANAYAKVNGAYKGIQAADDPNTGVTQFGVNVVPKMDTNAWLNEFSDHNKFKDNYNVKLGTTPSSVKDGYAYFKDVATPKPEAVTAAQQALINDPVYRQNMMINTPAEEMRAAGLDLNDPENAKRYFQGQLDNAALGIKPVTDESRKVAHIPKQPSATQKAADRSEFGNSGWRGSEYIASTVKLPNGEYRTTFNPTKGTSEGLKITTFTDKEGNPIDSKFAYVDHLSDGKTVDKIAVWKYDNKTTEKAKEIANKFAQELKPGQTEYTPEQNKAYASELEALYKTAAKPTKVFLPPTTNNLDLINGVYMEGKTNLDEYGSKVFKTAKGSVFLDPVSGKAIKQEAKAVKPVVVSGKINPATLKKDQSYDVGGKIYIWNGSKLVPQQ